MSKKIKIISTSDVIFVHSLFRSGSTYLYNAIKRTGKFHIYHEPMHEVIASLASSWDDLKGRKDELKLTLRHDFLMGGYFDEYSELLPGIKQLFDTKFSFDYYFLHASDEATDMKAYIDLLKDGASKPPILQCTRTSGRIDWLKDNYKSNHVFLLRNPWDQWYSYKVDPYIANTPRLIYSACNVPATLKAVFEASGACRLIGVNTQEKVIYSFEHPLTPEQDYFLFFGVWLHSLVCGQQECNVFIDMDELSASAEYRAQCLANLEKIGIQSVDFSDAKLHRTVFDSREEASFRKVEEQVLEIFQKHGLSIESACEYLEKARGSAFVSFKKLGSFNAGILEDAYRMRQLLSARYSQIESLNQAVQERDSQIESLNQAVQERDSQIESLNQAVQERDSSIAGLTDETVTRGECYLGLQNELNQAKSKINELTSSNSWQFTRPLREARRWLSHPGQQLHRYSTAAIKIAKAKQHLVPVSYDLKRNIYRYLCMRFPGASGLESGLQPSIHLPCENFDLTDKDQIYNYFESQKLNFDLLKSKTSTLPSVSVVIPVYGKIEYTLRCIASICQNLPKVDFELIVVDDCSPDDSLEILSKIEGIRLIRNELNQGFIRSCNAGAKVALGEYLYFLNNDTQVTPGWMDELLRTFHEFPGTGLAGSKLIYQDGRLQEAGGIIWQDGSAWNFGRFQDPLLPIYNYAREVDYCSGASIMVPQVLFDKLGGFDEHYLPAYCEDCDLALKIRDQGCRVIYQPLSTVIHYEGVTSGTDTSKGIKAYQVENTKKLFERWENRLQTHQPAGIDADKAKERRATRRVLVLDHCTPTPDKDAGSVITFNLMLLLREMDFQVTFIPEDNFLYIQQYTGALQRAGIEVLYAPYITSVEQHLKKFGERYDLAFLIRPLVVERHIRTIRKYCLKAKVLFHTVDLHFLRMLREAELHPDRAKQKPALEMKQRELAAIRAADATIVVSSVELELLRLELPDEKIHVFPLIIDVQGTSKPFASRRDIVFVGGYQHSPNVDAVKYFVTDIMPLMRHLLPGVRFYVVGSMPPAEIQALASTDVIITGYIEDLSLLLDKMRISVAPLRYGAGIKGKIGSAMAVGLPVVATTLAAEGMSLTDGENILIAEDVEKFADSVVAIYQNESLWNRISHNGLLFVENAWGAEAAWKNLNTILTDISLTTVRKAYPLSLFSGRDMAQKKIKNRPDQLTPIASVQNRQEFNLVMNGDEINKIRRIEKTLLIQSSRSEAFTVNGFCVPCGEKGLFLVDMESGGQRQGNSWLPNWRERLECPRCRMNNRQRLVATLVKLELDVNHKKNVYFMEQVTPIYKWAADTFKNHNITGSEYLGHDYKSGAVIQGIRHEDIENLSFPDATIDLIVSNDVFEHVPQPAIAFAECARVLVPGGVMLSTIPFHSSMDQSVSRARIVDGQLEHLLTPSYHGNPLSADGSLVFTDFGWDLLKEMRKAGFSEVKVEVYVSAELCHLGGGQLFFRLIK
jgi:GT2 family glycosyltransferase/glycosyltransferase involved in cell wall biosynthesis